MVRASLEPQSPAKHVSLDLDGTPGRYTGPIPRDAGACAATRSIEHDEGSWQRTSSFECGSLVPKLFLRDIHEAAWSYSNRLQGTFDALSGDNIAGMIMTQYINNGHSSLTQTRRFIVISQDYCAFRRNKNGCFYGRQYLKKSSCTRGPCFRASAVAS